MSSLIKEINRLINKGIYVLLFDGFNGCLVQLKKRKVCETFTMKKNGRSQNVNFMGRKI